MNPVAALSRYQDGGPDLVCVVRVLDGRAVRQVRDNCGDEGQAAAARARVDGWPAYQEPEHAPAFSCPDARARALDHLSIEAARRAAELNSLELGSTCRAFPIDTRSGWRTDDLALTDGDRDAARALVDAAGSCGSSWRKWRGCRATDAGVFDTRLVAQTHCGTRLCERCAESIRRWQVSRCLGAWSMFTTHTMPRGLMSKREAWDHFQGARKAFLREVRRTSSERYTARPRRTLNGRNREHYRRIQAQAVLIGPERLDYAWGLEPHADGYPHLHVVWSMEWIDYAWMRALWSRCLGVLDARMDGRKVWSTDGVCHYLAKYISKRRMPLDILAILKGRRTWASTLDSEDEEEPRWWPETAEYEEDKGQSVEARETWGRADGWRLESGQDGRYALWIRPAAVEGAALMRGNDFAGDVGVIRRQASMRALLREILNDADILIRAAQIADEYKNGKSDDIKKRAA